MLLGSHVSYCFSDAKNWLKFTFWEQNSSSFFFFDETILKFNLWSNLSIVSFVLELPALTHISYSIWSVGASLLRYWSSYMEGQRLMRSTLRSSRSAAQNYFIFFSDCSCSDWCHSNWKIRLLFDGFISGSRWASGSAFDTTYSLWLWLILFKFNT